jgi:flavin reductase (DIM6/NTAB) family NADH-FMN oxidoreductase RutF
MKMKGNPVQQLLMQLRGKFKPSQNTPPSQFVRVAYHTARQVVLLTTRHQGVENVWPIDWHLPLSFEPELYAVCLTSGGFGTELIRASGVFVVNFVPVDWQEIIFYCGRTSGQAVDKFQETGLVKETAVSIDAPRLKDALGFLECDVIQTVETGDHTLFIGQVCHAAQNRDAARLHHLDGRLEPAKEQFGDVRR